MKRCVFCGKEPPEIYFTKEHLISQWLTKHLKPSVSVSHTWKISKRNPNKPHYPLNLSRNERHFRGSTLEISINDVCNECNNDWLLKNVEWPIQETVIALAHGEKLELTAREVKPLALWAAKTALMRSLLDLPPTYAANSPFFYIRRCLRVPPFTSIWIAMTNQAKSKYFHRHIWLEKLRNDDIAIRTSVTTVVLGHFLFQVINADGQPDWKLGTPNGIGNLLREASGGAMQRIWPQPAPVMWPPSVGLTTAGALQISRELAEAMTGP